MQLTDRVLTAVESCPAGTHGGADAQPDQLPSSQRYSYLAATTGGGVGTGRGAAVAIGWHMPLVNWKPAAQTDKHWPFEKA